MGETILSAPVVEKGKTQRDIYLPVGCWKDGNNGSIYNGKRWLKNYPAPLDVLPYFIRQYNKTPIVSNTTIKTIYFKRSKVSATIFKKDDKYFVNIYNGNYIIKFN